jgi:hypothetical protein
VIAPPAFSLRKIARREQLEVTRTVARLGVAWTTSEAAVQSILELALAIEKCAPLEPARENLKAVASNTMLKSAARSVALEALDIARRHLAESRSKRRRAMEFMACAWIVWKDPRAALDWHESGENGQKFSETFANSRIRGALKELHGDMYDAFDKLSKRGVHASLPSIAHSARFSRPRDLRMLDIELFDDRAFERARFVGTLKAERILDSARGVIHLTEGFSRLALAQRPWNRAGREIRPRLEDLRDRVVRAQMHYAPNFARLEAFRRANIERLDKKGYRGRLREVLQAAETNESNKS